MVFLSTQKAGQHRNITGMPEGKTAKKRRYSEEKGEEI
jgi:hypothetical protein